MKSKGRLNGSGNSQLLSSASRIRNLQLGGKLASDLTSARSVPKTWTPGFSLAVLGQSYISFGDAIGVPKSIAHAPVPAATSNTVSSLSTGAK